MRASPIFAFVTAALLSTAPALAIGVDPAAATPVQREQAQGRFARGKELYARKDYARALAEFRGSHEIVASPNARLYIARCLRELGKLVAAYAELGRTETEAHELARDDARYAKTAESAAAERKELAPKLGFVTVTVQNATDETTLTIGGDPIKRAGWTEPAPVMPGTTEIVATTPGREPVRTQVTVASGQHVSAALDVASGAPIASAAPPPPPPAAPPPVDEGGGRGTTRALAYVAGGIGVAGLATFAIAGSMSNATYNDLQAQCHGPCPPSKADEVDKGKTQQTIANVGLVVGAVGLVAGATLFVLSMPHHADESPRAALVVGPAYAGVRGAF